MLMFFYLLISLSATLLGAVTGMGGGVFIKPALDLIGKQNVASISVLSSATVFTMSCISILKRRKSPERPSAKIAGWLALGAVIGGLSGERLFVILSSSVSNSIVTITQNAALIVIIAFVLFYIFLKEKFPSPQITGAFFSFIIGAALGLISAFIGIGGGPINVAVIMFAFAYPTKIAMQCSLLIVLFSQAAKLIITVILMNINGAVYDLTMLPVMLAGGAAGGFLGGILNARLRDKTCDFLFCAAQILVFGICIINIIKNL